MRLKRDFLDAAFSDFIRWRDSWTCRRCRAHYDPPTNQIQCAHIYTRGNQGLRHCPENAVALCAGCHCYFTFRKEEWVDWCHQTFGPEYMERLKIGYYTAKAPRKGDRELLAADFLAKIQVLRKQAGFIV